MINRLSKLPSPLESSVPLGDAEALYKISTSSPESASESCGGASPSTQTSGGAPVVSMSYAFRQSRGPHNPIKDVGFDWNGHAARTGRASMFCSKQLVTVNNVNNNLDAQTTWSPLVSTQSYTTDVPVDRGQPFATPTFSSYVAPRQLSSSIFCNPIPRHPYFQRQTQAPDLSNCAVPLPLQTGSPANCTVNGFAFNKQVSSAAPRQYIPSTMVLQELGLTTRDPARLAPGISYQGDIFSKPYLDQVEDLPDIDNCSLFIKFIPYGTPHSIIFDNIHCGAVWSLHFNPTTETTFYHGCQIGFYKARRSSGCHEAMQGHGLQIGGNWLDVRYNKHGMWAHSGTETRVLQIEGSLGLMTWAFWYPYFKTACVFQLDRCFYIPCPHVGRVHMEFRFARVDGQAQSCRQKIERDPMLNSAGVLVQYSPDPCDQVSGQPSIL
ncbi:hypothetical protein DL98DRAFT_598515 [Cadophora sp. DSE1049]|nr:hypothetical protein DL98DRAFT_598515 [Cadophora sp. DSE1049]